jgi:para-aminobenzoate synthetase component I
VRVERYSFAGDGFRVARALSWQSRFVWLDSSQYHPERGRYSFFAGDPFAVWSLSDPDALSVLRERVRALPAISALDPQLVPTPLPAGALGYISYDYGSRAQGIPILKPKTDDIPDVYFGFYDRMVTLDHLRQEIIVTSTGLPEIRPALREKRARERARELDEALADILHGSIESPRTWLTALPMEELPAVKEDFCRNSYLKAVRRVLDAISVGDLYQLNLSRRFTASLPPGDSDPLALYRLLRHHSPSPFGGYLNAGEHHLISHSPERFVSLRGRDVSTRPMKGTRPRDSDPLRDAALRTELIGDPKEMAELLMITDLSRNDLGRVCEYGSVRVREPRTIEAYATVYQATSTVEGRLSPGLDAWDVLDACFPGGSITGCPKIMATRMIEAIEPVRRGIYTGVMGYVSFTGDMDFNMLIRTLLMTRDQVCFHVGGGIVADSRPEREYEETEVKARAMLESWHRYVAGRRTPRGIS